MLKIKKKKPSVHHKLRTCTIGHSFTCSLTGPAQPVCYTHIQLTHIFEYSGLSGVFMPPFIISVFLFWLGNSHSSSKSPSLWGIWCLQAELITEWVLTHFLHSSLGVGYLSLKVRSRVVSSTEPWDSHSHQLLPLSLVLPSTVSHHLTVSTTQLWTAAKPYLQLIHHFTHYLALFLVQSNSSICWVN